jgi:hypothetical protein
MKVWQTYIGIDFLPAQARALQRNIFHDFQHPVYSYCFGKSRGRKLDVLSPIASRSSFRIPSIANFSSEKLKAVASKVKQEDEKWLKDTFDDIERDTLERFVRHPLVSPVYGDFTGLPPVLIVKKYSSSKLETVNFFETKQSHWLSSIKHTIQTLKFLGCAMSFIVI